MKSAEKYPDFAGELNNIQFLKGINMDVREHFDGDHGGDYHNFTNGYYDPITETMVDFGTNVPWENYIRR